MTREEAITILQDKYDCCKSFYDLAAHPEEDYPEMAKYLQALQIALTALHPVSREKIEKVWRGKWEHPGYYDDGGSFVHDCSKCNTPSTDEYWFCPICGALMTDEAVQMVVERLEALKDV